MPHTTGYLAPIKRVRALAALLVVPALLLAPSTAAEIFKCVAKDGSGAPLYQNFPCSLDSLGLPSNPSAVKPPPAGAIAETSKQIVGTPDKLASPSELRVGMSADEVRVLLGEPEEMVADEPAEGGPVSLWRYADGRSVRFDHKHYVVEVQR